MSQNGKGDSPRNNYSESFRSNYDAINWKKKDILKSSEEWLAQLYPTTKILDYDGWNRTNSKEFEKSWNEKITKEEFEKRFVLSTIYDG